MALEDPVKAKLLPQTLRAYQPVVSSLPTMRLPVVVARSTRLAKLLATFKVTLPVRAPPPVNPVPAIT